MITPTVNLSINTGDVISAVMLAVLTYAVGMLRRFEKIAIEHSILWRDYNHRLGEEEHDAHR